MRRFCTTPGCSTIVAAGRCAAHQPAARLEQRRHYTGTPGINYGRRWQREAKAFLVNHLWCALCPGPHRAVAAEVDHIVPHRGDADLFWDRSNWQAVCKPCHSAKTAREVRA